MTVPVTAKRRGGGRLTGRQVVEQTHFAIAAPMSAFVPPAGAITVWADTAYRSAANLALLDRRGRVPQFQRPNRGASRCRRTSAAAEGQGRARLCRQKRRLRLVIRTIDLARATTKITLANLAYNVRRLMWIEGRTLPA
jgi:hypothetical protein